MAKITKLTERWVEVTPAYTAGRIPTIRECEDIAVEIRRHVDGLDVLRRDKGVDVREKHESFCEHCNSRWTETSAEYNGGCCDKDEGNNPETVAALQVMGAAMPSLEAARSAVDSLTIRKEQP